MIASHTYFVNFLALPRLNVFQVPQIKLIRSFLTNSMCSPKIGLDDDNNLSLIKKKKKINSNDVHDRKRKGIYYKQWCVCVSVCVCAMYRAFKA